jgi:hypothetical protein
MNNNKLEQSSVTKLRDCLDRCIHLEHDIKENDKTPTWDGEIRIYRSPEFKVGMLIGVARAQVKAQKVATFLELSAKTIKRPVRVDDLLNYKNEGGTIYFVIYIYDFDCYRIYYNALLPLDISNWLKIAGTQNTITLPFEELPIADSQYIEQMILNFLNDRKKQFSTVVMLPEDDKEKAIIFSKFDQFSFGVVGTSEPFDYMFKHPIYLYGDIQNIKVPLHKVQAEVISTTLPMPVTICGVQYYSEVTIEKSIDDELFCFGECFKLSTATNKIHFKESGNLECRWKALNFIKALKEHKQINIEESYFQFDDFHLDGQRQFDSYFEKLSNLRNALLYFGANQLLNCDLIQESDNKNIEILISAYKNKGQVTFNESMKPSFCCLEVANLKLLLNITHINGFTYKIERAFRSPSDNCELHHNDSIVPCSIFCILKQEDFQLISNMDYGALLADLKKYPLQGIYTDKLVGVLLDMLRAYDITQNDDLLDACGSLAKHMTDEDGASPIHVLNYLQCIKRKRRLDAVEKQMLYRIRDTETNASHKLAVGILLENQSDVHYYFSCLTDSEKKEFLSYPITLLSNELSYLKNDSSNSSLKIG